MDTLLEIIDNANKYLVERDAINLEKALSDIVQISANLFPRIISSYMDERMKDCISDVNIWVSLFERIIGISEVVDGFVLYDILNNMIAASVVEYRNLINERNVVIE